MTHSFPSLMSIEAFATWRADPSQWLPIAIDIAHSHSLSCADPHVFSTGTNLVVGLNSQLILKIFPPLLRHQFVSERAALSQLHGRLSVPIPQIALEGERSQWPYLVITRMSGVIGTEVWVDIPEDQKESVLSQIGEIIAEVQRVPTGGLSHLKPQWEQFIPKQIEGCRARHEGLGLPQKYLDGLERLVQDAATLVPMNAAPVILTGEYNPENIFLSQHSGGWRLAGLIDFGDVMTGWGEYDLLGPSTFMTEGKPGRVRSLLRGFGYSEANTDPALPRRLMALLLLHRFSNLTTQICIEDWQQKAADLYQLERLLWPI
jgi:hygromycin-B 7''-O-kinase